MKLDFNFIQRRATANWPQGLHVAQIATHERAAYGFAS